MTSRSTAGTVTITCPECHDQLDLYAKTTQRCGCGRTETLQGILTQHDDIPQAEV